MAVPQEKLNDTDIEVVSGGGVIKVTASEKVKIKRIHLTESLSKLKEK